MVRGVGEIVEGLAPAEQVFVVVTPSFGVSTVAVYAAFDEVGAPTPGFATNDLERAALVVEPRLVHFRELLAEASGLQPSLAGSGATWFVECEPPEAPAVAGEIRRRVETTKLSALVAVTRAVP
jgi:4-diphosphocytidyl-2-C-methyl-D-erythritol kinase